MANNMIELVAKLNTDESEKQIKNDLEIITKSLSSNPIKISCSIDTSNIKAIQEQLKDISKGLKLDIFSGGSDGRTKNVTNDIVKSFNEAFGMIGKMGETTKKEFNAQTKAMLQEFKTAWQNGLATGDTKAYYEALDKLGQRISEFSRGDVKLLKEAISDIRREFTDGSIVSIGSNLKKELDYLTGSDTLTRQKLDALYGSGKYTIGTGNAGYDTLFQRDEEATNAILNAADKILSYQNKIRSVGWGLDELQEIGLSTREIETNIEDALRQIVGLPKLPNNNEWIDINVTDDIQEVNQLSMAIERLGESESNAGEQTEEWRKKQERVQQDYEILAATIKKAKLNIDEIATRDGVNYNQIFNDLMSGDITNAAKLNEAKDAIAAIRKEFRLVNAEMASDIPQNAIEGLVSRIAKADSQIKVLKIDFDKLSQVPDYLQESFGKLQETMKGFDFSSDYQINSKEELSQRVQQYTQIKVALNDTQALLKVAQKEEQSLNAETAKRDKEIERQIKLRQQEINKARELNEAEMHNYWQGRFEETVKGMTAENAELKALKEQLLGYNKVAKETEKQQKRTFQNDSRISNLTNQINNYAKANKKAIESMKVMRSGTTFADEWQRIVTTLKSGNLDENAIRQLAQDFRNFKGEAESAGLSVNRLFASMQSQLRLVLQRWISLYAVVRYIREMVDNVKSLDAAMINLKRVTDATDESYAKFLEDANKQAAKLKTTTSSLIEQAYQWAKLGYTMEEGLDLANASTIFMRVADVDQEQALSNLVTALKAYRIEAKDTIEIVDKLDKLNNEFAVSASGLGEGLERSASSLYMTGNTLDQSLAMLTGAGEITQNLENTGNALKVVALRLQGMKGALEELDEPVDDLMEVSKI